MIKLSIVSLRKFINKSYLKIKPFREDFENFKNELSKFLSLINNKESEEHNKNFIRDFLKNTFYQNKYVNTKGRTDLAIHLEKSSSSKVGIIIEAKSPVNKSDMISEDNLNRKSMHEVILYYLRERIEFKNDEIKHIIITNAYEWFLFDANQFEKCFYKSKLKEEYEKWKNNQKVSGNNDFFYELIKNYLNDEEIEIEGIHFDLRDFQRKIKDNEKSIIPLFKIFSPPELLKEPFLNDSNNLNKEFYLELLHIIGLEEHKEGSKKVIGRKTEQKRDSGSLLENTIRILESEDSLKNLDNAENFGETEDEQLFNLALELNITWINRILFLKLLEAQLVNYHNGNHQFKFLDPKIIIEYDDLYELFHEILAVKTDERSSDIIEKFKNIPYLNSSLFDRTELERKTIRISNLKDRFDLNFYSHTVFSKEVKTKEKLPALEYLLRFLDAYDFASESGEEIQEERKTIINASVLGLIFEKINGYKEGSYYTPGFITMYMARETLRRAVVQKFSESKGTEFKDYEELRKNIDTSSEGREEANKIINSLKICDPAVGSGHFLVSCLNEIIAIKADLRILNDREGRQVRDFSFEVENDELVISDEINDELFTYNLNPGGKPITSKQELQETLFHEKETIIENCLFGVDINPNSVNICRLRLWIELLKNSYYNFKTPRLDKEMGRGEVELQTLPNIDINIKQGNSLISRFDIKHDIFTQSDKQTLDVYKLNVQLYKNEQDKSKRRELKDSIEKTKNRFRGIAVDPLQKERTQISKFAEQLHEINKEDLFAGDLTKEEKEKIEKKRNTLTGKIEKLKTEIENKEKDYKTIYSNSFEWRFEFPEVLDEEGNFEGFDVVIGNPPYISGRDWGNSRESEKKYYNDHFLTAEYQLDLYQLFIEKSEIILKQFGLINLIIPNTWLANHKTTRIRRFVLDKFSMIDFTYSLNKIFSEADVDTIIFFAKNISIKNSYHSITRIEGNRFKPSHFKNQKNYNTNLDFVFNIFVKEEDEKIISKLEKNKKLMIEIFEINRGIHAYRKDGYGKSKFSDGPQVQRDYDEKSYHSREKLDKTYIKELRGKNIFPYYRSESGNYISYGNWLAEPRELKYFVGERIYLRKIVGEKGLIACLLDKNDEFIADQSIYIAKPKNNEVHLKSIVAILNSRLMGFYFRLKYNEFDKLFPQIKIGEFKNLPINSTKVKKIEKLVDQILEQKKQNPKADTSALEKQIDEMVYKLYGLTEEEIKIVENKR